MRLSTETSWLRRRFDNYIAIKMIKDAGFDAFDFSFCYMMDQPENDMLDDDYIDKAYKLRAYMDEIGIECNQAHAPLDFDHTDEIALENVNYLRNVRSIAVASILGAQSIVVHPVGSVLQSELDYFEYNGRYLKSYIPYCEKFKMHISVENLNTYSDGKPIGISGFTTPQEIITWVNNLESEWFNICVDTGHSAITGIEPEDMISAMDNRQLAALHIHDNDRLKDQHLLPYAGSLNWEKITTALRKISYKGDFTLEAINFFSGVPDELIMPSLCYAEQVGRFLIDKILNE